MVDILVRPTELRQISEQLISSAKKIDVALQAIDNDILSLKGDKFLGNRANTVQGHYAPKRNALLNAKEKVAHFAVELKNAATAFEKADQGGRGGVILPGTGGLWATDFRLDPLIMRYLVSSKNLIQSIPEWLQGKLASVFRPVEIVSPLGIEIDPRVVEGGVSQDPRLNSQPIIQGVLVSTESAHPAPLVLVADEGGASPRTAVDVSFNVPAKSQGSLYGNAACSQTSVSMVLDYYSAQNVQNKTVSPQDLISMMDKGDGTYGKGMSLSNLTDELNDLGYKNITQQVGAQYSDLRSAVKDGPVIVTSGVKIIGPGTVAASSTVRALDGPGNTIHAMVVTGVGDDQVNVNDPWSGQQIQLPRATFEKMWSRGSSAIYSIRP